MIFTNGCSYTVGNGNWPVGFGKYGYKFYNRFDPDEKYDIINAGGGGAGNTVIRAWEREGASFTAQKGEQPLPGWRLFRVDRIGSFNLNPTETFDSPRPLYNPNDKGMTDIKLCAKFELE
jgi:hypothetical protein